MARSSSPLGLDDWAQFFSYQGLTYGMPFTQTLGQKVEEIGGDFSGLIEGAYKSNGPVFSCSLVRMMLFSEARFQYRRFVDGRPGELFGSRDLRILEKPYPGGTTRKLLTRAIQDVDLAGNWFGARRNGHIFRMRPDWVTIIVGSRTPTDRPELEIDAEIVGYIYHPGGRNSGQKAQPLLPQEVAHFAPIPDPQLKFRGMSWLVPVIREVMGDSAMTTHKIKFLENGASPNLVVTLDKEIQKETFAEWIDAFEAQHEGYLNAYKTLYLGAGANVEVIGANMRQLDFKQVQGAGETRIAAAAGVPPIIAGFSEGLQSATYSNYGQARRRFADGTMRPLWGDFASSIATLLPEETGAELWYDDRDIPFLQEDVEDDARIQATQSISIRQLIDAGFEPDTVTDAVTAGDLKRLKHTGLFSVQLQPAGTVHPPGSGSGDDGAEQGRAALEELEKLRRESGDHADQREGE